MTDTPEDQRQLVDYTEAVAWLEQHQCNGKAEGFGLGFALGPDDGGGFWQGIDLDQIDVNGLTDLVPALPGYVEHSPSGKGVHAIGDGSKFANIGARGSGKEAYSSGRFFTFTGDVIRDAPLCDLTKFVQGNIGAGPGAPDNVKLKVSTSQVVVAPEVYDELLEAA